MKEKAVQTNRQERKRERERARNQYNVTESHELPLSDLEQTIAPYSNSNIHFFFPKISFISLKILPRSTKNLLAPFRSLSRPFWLSFRRVRTRFFWLFLEAVEFRVLALLIPRFSAGLGPFLGPFSLRHSMFRAVRSEYLPVFVRFR